jgi:2TM domain-containing protein
MLTKTVTKNGQAPLETLEAPEDAALRTLALKQLERIRSFKLHLAMFLVGMPAVTAVWALTEYMNADGWPERFSDSAGPSNWNPWILWVLFIWGGLLAIQGVRAYFGRPPTESEIDREIARLKTRG